MFGVLEMQSRFLICRFDSIEPTLKFVKKASFVSNIQHENSFNLMNKIGVLDENNLFNYDRA